MIISKHILLEVTYIEPFYHLQSVVDDLDAQTSAMVTHRSVCLGQSGGFRQRPEIDQQRSTVVDLYPHRPPASTTLLPAISDCRNNAACPSLLRRDVGRPSLEPRWPTGHNENQRTNDCKPNKRLSDPTRPVLHIAVMDNPMARQQHEEGRQWAAKRRAGGNWRQTKST